MRVKNKREASGLLQKQTTEQLQQQWRECEIQFELSECLLTTAIPPNKKQLEWIKQGKACI